VEVSDTWKLKELAEENQRLKQMYADLSLTQEAIKDIAEKEFYNTYVLAPRIPSNTTNAGPGASPEILGRKKEAFLMKIWSRSQLRKYLSKGKDPGC
jgi:putative transposase